MNIDIQKTGSKILLTLHSLSSVLKLYETNKSLVRNLHVLMRRNLNFKGSDGINMYNLNENITEMEPDTSRCYQNHVGYIIKVVQGDHL